MITRLIACAIIGMSLCVARSTCSAATKYKIDLPGGASVTLNGVLFMPPLVAGLQASPPPVPLKTPQSSLGLIQKSIAAIKAKNYSQFIALYDPATQSKIAAALTTPQQQA